MSQRVVKKFMQKQEDLSEEQVESLKQEIQNLEIQKKPKQVFQMLIENSEDEHSGSEKELNQVSENNQQNTKSNPTNNKKKKNKAQKAKNKKNQPEKINEAESKNENEIFEQILKQELPQSFNNNIDQEQKCHPFTIITKKLNYQKEFQRIFKEQIQPEKASQQSRMQKQLLKQSQHKAKKYRLTYNSDIYLPLQHRFICTQVGINTMGQIEYSLTVDDQYKKKQIEYIELKNMADPNLIFDFLHRNPQHCEALFDVSEFFRLKGDYKQSNQLMEQLLYIYEDSCSFLFNQIFDEEKYIDVSLQIGEYTITLLNALFKFTDILNRRGCNKSALEFCKLLIRLNSTQDPTGVLFVIDYLANCAQQYDFLIEFCRSYGDVVFKKSNQTIGLLPNFIYSLAYAKFFKALIDKPIEQLVKITKDDVINASQNFKANFIDANHNELLIQAILLYPKVLLLMCNHNDFKKQNVGNFDHFINNQRKPFKELFDHYFLAKETHLYGFLEICTEEDISALTKLIEIYVERSNGLWKNSNIYTWIKSALGMIINCIEDQSLNLHDFYQSQGESNYWSLPFEIKRYNNLVKTNFSSQVERLDVNQVFGDNIGAVQQQQQLPNQVNMNQGLLGMIGQLLLPWVNLPQQQGQQQQ